MPINVVSICQNTNSATHFILCYKEPEFCLIWKTFFQNQSIALIFIPS